MGDFLLVMVVRFFWKIFASPARGEDRTGDATVQKSQKKIAKNSKCRIFCDKIQVCPVACARVATHAILTVRWRRDILEKSHRKHKIALVAAA